MNAFVSSAMAAALVRMMLVLSILVGAFHAPHLASEAASGEQTVWVQSESSEHASLDGACAGCSKCEEACVPAASQSSMGVGRARPVHALARMRPKSDSQPLAKPPRD